MVLLGQAGAQEPATGCAASGGLCWGAPGLGLFWAGWRQPGTATRLVGSTETGEHPGEPSSAPLGLSPTFSPMRRAEESGIPRKDDAWVRQEELDRAVSAASVSLSSGGGGDRGVPLCSPGGTGGYSGTRGTPCVGSGLGRAEAAPQREGAAGFGRLSTTAPSAGGLRWPCGSGQSRNPSEVKAVGIVLAGMWLQETQVPLPGAPCLSPTAVTDTVGLLLLCQHGSAEGSGGDPLSSRALPSPVGLLGSAGSRSAQAAEVASPRHGLVLLASGQPLRSPKSTHRPGMPPHPAPASQLPALQPVEEFSTVLEPGTLAALPCPAGARLVAGPAAAAGPWPGAVSRGGHVPAPARGFYPGHRMVSALRQGLLLLQGLV